MIKLHLDISHCILNIKHAVLLGWLLARLPNLQELFLNLSGNGLNTNAVKTICKGISSYNNLIKLHLDFN